MIAKSNYLHASDSKIYAWAKKVNDCLPSVGASETVRGIISWARNTSIVQMLCKINAELYKQFFHQHIIEQVLHPSLCEFPTYVYARQWPCQKAKKVSYEMFRRVRPWGCCDGLASLDSKPIKNVWKIIGEWARKRNSRTANHLWQLLEQEWEGIGNCWYQF